MKKIISICLILLMLLGVSAQAASVTYEGQAEKFVFLPNDGAYGEDLFVNFKEVMPGDTLEQKITVKNDTLKRVRIFLRAEPTDEVSKDFLNQLTMTVECRNKEIFDAPAGETAQLTENTLLGSFHMTGSTELTVKLNVPITLSSEYMGRVGIVPWTFVVEEVPEQETPNTGDWFQMGMWLSIAAVLATAIVALVLVQRKRAKN